MEPSDPSKNTEGIRLSRRRISSILKAPRRSSVAHDTEQEENEVEKTKPVEKRNSRRVSFAPANDVVLFDTDVKDAGQARGPLQELMAAAAATAQNRAQLADTDDGGRQILGIESLLSAPLHASQRTAQVGADRRRGFQEDTVIFSTEDDIMDFTQNHTVNISLEGGADLLGGASHQNLSLMVGRGRTAGGAPQPAPSSADGIKDSEPLLDPDFENFLLSLSKPSSSNRAGAAPPPSEQTSQTQTDDKENQVPESMRSSRSVAEPQNLKVHLTQAPTELRGGGRGGDEDHRLFPTQDVFTEQDGRSSQDRHTSSGSETGTKSLKLPAPREKPEETLLTAVEHVEKTGRFSADNVTLSHSVRCTANNADMDRTGNMNLNSQLRQSVKVSLPSREETLGLAAGEATMDITQCLTANISSISASDSALFTAGQDETCDPQPRRSSVRPDSKTGVSNLSTNTSVNPRVVQEAQAAVQPSEGFTVRPDDDVCRGLTGALTGYMLEGCLDIDKAEHLSLSAAEGTQLQSVHLRKEVTSSYQQSTENSGSSAYEETSVSSLKTLENRHQATFDSEEKTVRFTAANANMDATTSHTIDIIAHLPPRSLPMADDTRTVWFKEDADVEATQSHAEKVNLNVASDQSLSLVPANREKTVALTTGDGDMDLMRMNPENISTCSEPRSHQNAAFYPPCGDKTVRFTTSDASLEMTNCFTVSIEKNPVSYMDLTNQNSLPGKENLDFHLPCGDKTVRFTTNDASLEMTNCFTASIERNPVSSMDLTNQNSLPGKENLDFPSANPDSSSAHLEQELQSSVSLKSASLAHAGATDTAEETAESDSFQAETQEPETNAESESPSLVWVVVDKPGNETMTSCAETESSCLRPASKINDPQHNLSSTQEDWDHFNSQTQGPPDDAGSNKMETTAVERFPPAQKTEPGEASTSRRKSLADLQSKLKHLSTAVKAAPDTTDMDGSMARLPQPVDPDTDKTSDDKTASFPEAQPELQDDTGAQSRPEEPFSAANPTLFKLKTQQLMSKLSFGGFKPKLPQRNNPEEGRKSTLAGEATRTLTVDLTSRLRDLDHDFDDVFNEELGSCEDMSETSDTGTPEKSCENQNPSREFHTFEPLEEDFFKEPFASPFHNQKRPLPECEGDKIHEKKLKRCTEVDTEFQPNVVHDLNNAASQATTQNIDSSNSSRSEAASESTSKPSLFESQLDEYRSDGEKLQKLKDGTIAVMEFFRLFNIDFVIYNPRQSVLPDTFSSDADVTSLDLLRNRHINRPRIKVYEADIQILSARVEELKVRLQDLNKPLRTVNRRLWEELRRLSEKELKAFGAKLKERNSFFRKTSKVQSHQMKEVLYTNLVRVNQEEQQKLRGMITKADVMLKSLDDCISGLESEINAIMEKDTDDKKCIKTLQDEYTKTSAALAETNRQISELELQKKQNSSKANKLKAETDNLQNHIDTLNMLNEWRLGEKKDGRMSFTFLYESMILELLFEKLDGNDADSGAKKITNIDFEFLLDEETSRFHAHLVHKLVSQHIQGESGWLEKYPTSRHVPKLLHDVSLVVSSCRLLGEELRLLKMWGALRYDILDISSAGTQVCIVFSCLEKMTKFEVVFSIGLTNHLYAVHVQSFKNKYGNTTIQQIEEIMASVSSDTKLFTQIVSKIHSTLLS